MVIFAVDKRDIHGLASQFLGGRQATEAAADDYNLRSFHLTAHMYSPVVVNFRLRENIVPAPAYAVLPEFHRNLLYSAGP